MHMNFSREGRLTTGLLVLVLVATVAVVYGSKIGKVPSSYSDRGPQKMDGTEAQDALAQGAPQGAFGSPPSKEHQAAFRRLSIRAYHLEKEALRLFKAKEYERAEVVCSQAIWALGMINGQPFNSSAMRLQGEIRLAQKQYSKALESFERASQFNRSPEQSFGKALAYLGLNNLSEARKLYTLTEAQYLRRIPSEKREYFRQDLPGTKDKNSLKASIFFLRGKQKSMTQEEDAIKDLEAAHQLVPRNALVASSCGHVSRRLKRYDQAARYFAITARLGKGYLAERATKLLADFPEAQREAAIRAAAKIS